MTQLHGSYHSSSYNYTTDDRPSWASYRAFQVNKIVSWGISSDHSVANFSWEYDGGYPGSPMSIGNGSISNTCTSFGLEVDEYINAYRVIYDTQIRGLVLYYLDETEDTFKSFECFANGGISENNYTDSGIIYYKYHYLSGFKLSPFT